MHPNMLRECYLLEPRRQKKAYFSVMPRGIADLEPFVGTNILLIGYINIEGKYLNNNVIAR